MGNTTSRPDPVILTVGRPALGSHTGLSARSALPPGSRQDQRLRHTSASRYTVGGGTAARQPCRHTLPGARLTPAPSGQ